MTAEQLLAGVVLAMCVGFALRMLAGERRRQRFDAALGRVFATLKRGWHAAVRAPGARRKARKAAADAIERARRVERDGNVLRPKSFDRKDKPPRHLH
jgi:hypothetical protein